MLKAAERWIVKNPPEPYRDIRDVFNTYRPPGRTRWSKPLVRHGADARAALAEVLGVAAECIRVRYLPHAGGPSRVVIPKRANTEAARLPRCEFGRCVRGGADRRLTKARRDLPDQLHLLDRASLGPGSCRKEPILSDQHAFRVVP
jgi:hypothetical protein